MPNQLILSLVAGIFISCAAGYLGTLMLSKRMVLVTGPLGHLTLPGIALALLYGFNVSLGAFPFVIAGIVFIWVFELKTRLPVEAITAVVFASGVAIAFLFLPMEKAEAALIGDISGTGPWETVVSAVISLILIIVIRRIYPSMVLINISEDLATSSGVNIRINNFLYLLSIAVIVALGVRIVGGLLTAALVASPSASARNLSRNMNQFTVMAIIIGAASSSAGILLSRLTGFSAGPLIILVNMAVFLASTILRK